MLRAQDRTSDCSLAVMRNQGLHFLAPLAPLLASLMFPAIPAEAAAVQYQGNLHWLVGADTGVPVGILGLTVPPGLGSLHFVLTYNPNELSFANVLALGTPMGDLLRDEIQQTIIQTPGQVELTWVSLLSPSDLYARQDPTFPLMSFLFRIRGLPGEALDDLVYRNVNLTGELFDALGNPIPDVAFVPEPGTGWDAASGFALLAALLTFTTRRLR
jgi:hypothetical protein